MFWWDLLGEANRRLDRDSAAPDRHRADEGLIPWVSYSKLIRTRSCYAHDYTNHIETLLEMFTVIQISIFTVSFGHWPCSCSVISGMSTKPVKEPLIIQWSHPNKEENSFELEKATFRHRCPLFLLFKPPLSLSFSLARPLFEKALYTHICGKIYKLFYGPLYHSSHSHPNTLTHIQTHKTYHVWLLRLLWRRGHLQLFLRLLDHIFQPQHHQNRSSIQDLLSLLLSALPLEPCNWSLVL